MSLKYGTFCTIHSYIWLSVNLLSAAELMACVIKSAYDKLPQAFRRDEFFFDEPVVVDGGVDVGAAVMEQKKRRVQLIGRAYRNNSWLAG